MGVLSIITNLLGGGVVGTLLGGIMGWLGKKQDLKLAELQARATFDLRKLELDYQAKGAELAAKGQALAADATALGASIAADRATYGDSWPGRVVDLARGLVRPVVTYLSVALVLSMTVEAIRQRDAVQLAASMNLCAMVIGWWFGARVATKGG